MSDTPFDIDDILNEINKRKEEIEREINSVSLNINSAESSAPEKEIKAEAPVEENTVAPEPEAVEPAEEINEEAFPEDGAQSVENEAEKDEADTDGDGSGFAFFEDVDKLFSGVDDSDEGADASDPESLIAEAEPSKKTEREKSDKKGKKSKKRKIFISVIAVLLIAVIGAGAFGFYYVNKILNDVTEDDNRNSANSKVEEWTGMDELVVHFDEIYEGTDIDSYRDYAREWYYNGDPVSSTNILNIILIGEDTRGEDIMEEDTLADSVIIASVNIESGELILSSILRDTYAYYELVPGDETTGRYGKINECMLHGDLNAYINAVERLYKVNIDNYVLVNFASFTKIIDTLGGVDIEMTAKEIREINNHPSRYGDVYIEGDAGVKHLNGEQALAYSRIRYIDSDIYRANRQRTVLLDVFRQLKEASAIKLTSVVTSLLPYVKTGFTKNEILNIGQYALSRGWLSYKIVTHTVPLNETTPDGTVLNVWVDDKSYGTSSFRVDFPLATQVLQEKIYGKSCVVLAEDRPNFRTLSAY